MINNKKVFEIYMIFRLLMVITILIFGVEVITKTILRIDLLEVIFPNYGTFLADLLIALNFFSIGFLLIDERIKPAFIEFQIIKDKIIIETYNPHSNRWESPFILFAYKKRIKELKISNEEYIDYKLTIGKFGIKKEMKLQKINTNSVYESANINISLLGQRKYANLISALDSFKN